MSRLNLRNKPRISYYEPDEPNLDEYVFCSHCGDFVYEYCSIHGPLLVIPDDKPPTISPFPPCVPRAALTIPHVFLHIAPSKIPGAGLGVFTTLTLPSGVRFGPYEGEKTEEITSMYCWQINDYNNKSTHVIDAEDPNKSNWMRYVNCSRHWYEQNLIAFQYRGRLYYRTIKIIPRYTELMVFYGSEFAHMLQINLKKYNAPASYAQKFGTPAPKHSSSEGSEHIEISLLKNCIKEKSTKSLQSTGNNSNLSNIQQNKIPNDVPKKHLEKTLQSSHKKVKFNVPKKIQKDENKTPIISNKRKNNALNSKNITSIKNNQFAEILETEDKSISKSCDFNKNEKVNSECSKQLSKKFNENIVKTSTKENNSENESNLEKNNDIKSSEIKVDNPILSKTLVQNINSCDKCNFKTSFERDFKTHLLAHVAKTKYICSYCDYITKFKESLNLHLRTHTGEKPYACKFCERKFNQKISLNHHIRTHTGEKPYACNFCERKFNQKCHLNLHIRTHTGEKPYACKFCEKQFNRKSSLNLHIRTHTGEKPYACNFCEKQFNQKSNLNHHMRTHTGEKPYACRFCERKFNHKGALNLHIRTHTGEKPYACNFCEKQFNRKSSLNLHIRTHTGEKPYACNFCEKQFNRKDILNLHIRTHTGEKPYACRFCERKFNHKGALNLHIRTHTGEKPYACKFCERKFNQKCHLNLHIRTHTGEKPYACKFCERKFNDNSSLNIHIRTHTGEKPYACNFCERKFNHKINLILHIKTHNIQ